MFNEKDVIGLQYNCFGELHTSMDLVISGLFPSCEALFDDDGWCSDDYYFDYEPYVVACCGEYTVDLKPTYQQYCVYDLYVQVCTSLALRLQHLVQDGYFGLYGDKGAELQSFVAQHQEECFDAFLNNNTAELPHVQTFWDLSQDFGLLADVVFHIDSDTRIDGLNAPAFEGEWPTCNGTSYNDDMVFGGTGQKPLGGIAIATNLASPVQAELAGPVVFGGAVNAYASFETSCTPHGCPGASFSYDREGAGFGLDAFTLVHDTFEITNGTYSLAADRVQIQLYAPAKGAKVFDVTGAFVGYEIPPGAASFLVSGKAGDTANRFLAANATSIWVVPGPRGTWRFDGFVIEFVDGNHDSWALMVEESQWY